MNNKITIFTLDCPKTGLIKFVGKTNMKLNIKLKQLVYASDRNNSKLSSWIKDLAKEGLEPVINLHKEVSISSAEKEVEKLIKFLIKTNHTLLNNVHGKKEVITLQLSKGVILLVNKRAKKEKKAKQELIEELLIKELV